MLKKVFRQMAVAQVISSMTVLLCLLIDSIMIGQYLGVESMAAYGLSNPLLLAFGAIGSMISAGVQVCCGKTIGSGDEEGTNATYSVAIAISVAVSVVGVCLVTLFRNPLSSLLGAQSGTKVFELTSDYVLGFIIGAPAFLFSMILVPFLQLAGKQSRLVLAVLVMVISDVTFDLLNVHVFHGGMLGMGIASSLSYYLAFVFGIIYFLKKDCIFRFRFRHVNMENCRKILKAGIPTIINMISLVVLSYVMNQILLHLEGSNEQYVAAYSVISTVSNICYAFCSGIAGVTLMLAGVFYYEEDRKSLYELEKVMLRNAVLVDAVVTAVVLIGAPLLAALFVEDQSTSGLAAFGIRIFVLSLVISSINTGFKHFYQGTGKIGLTELLSILQNFLCPAFFAFILSFWLGTTGVWFGYLFGELLVCLFIAVMVWRKNQKIEISIPAFAMLSDSFGIPEEDCLTLTIREKEQVSEASRQVYDYCRSKEKSDRICHCTSLCVEEICNNIVSYGFEKKHKYTADVRIFCKEDQLVLRFRDDCRAFDPMTYMKMNKEKDSVSHIGIRMVFSLAKEVNYTNSLALNNLMIKL